MTFSVPAEIDAAASQDREAGANARQHKPRISRRSFLTLAAASIGGLGLYAAEISRHELSIEQHTVRLPRLPDAFRGMRILQVSDIHYLEFTEPIFLREVVRKINSLRADMVVLTGDFMTFGPLPHRFSRRHAPECAAILSEITCPLRYATLGNHDYIIGKQYVQGPLEDHRIPVLLNQIVPLERDGQRIWLAGLGSACEKGSDPDRAIPRKVANGNETLIVLAHEPDILPEISRYNADLMLSGHTHGGQVRIPFMPAFHLPAYGRRYIEGWFQYGATRLYVNRGIGAVGVPVRFRCPPEITVFTLA